MTDFRERTRSAFRLNLEQQRKQAKDLLKAAKASDATALARMSANVPDAADKLRRNALKLADAQHAIARELRFASWPDLKAHIESLDRARDAIRTQRSAPDAEMRTLHLRCGSDIKQLLVSAGLGGDFLEVSYPYCHGPVTAGPDHFEIEARYIAESAGKYMNVTYDGALAWRHSEEQQLAASAADYERVVLWKEHDCYDQLVLVRCLAHYASTAAPRVLELIDIDYFPGRQADGVLAQFRGLGQLPEEALRLLWNRRRPVTQAQLALATEVWNALTLDDPRPLAAIMRTGAAALPHLGFALHRFLQELPSVKEGLSLTERFILEILSEQSVTLNQLFGLLTSQRDPLFFATDLKMLQIVECMQELHEPVVTRVAVDGRWQDTVAITDTGRAVLQGDRDWISLQPPSRWVGGVQIRPGIRNWRWDEGTREATLV